MNFPVRNAFFYCLLVGLLCSCGSLHIHPGEKIYWANEISVDNIESKKDRRKLEKYLSGKINPDPVKHTLGMQLKILKYKPDSLNADTSRTPKYGFFRQEPVVYEKNYLNRGELILRNYLDREGFFNSKVVADTVMSGDMKVRQNFHVEVAPRFVIERVEYFCPSDDILRTIRDTTKSPYLKVSNYLVPTFSDLEKDRIRKVLSQRGYFKADLMKIKVKIDTLSYADKDSFAYYYPESYADTIQSEHEKIALVKVIINHTKGSDTLSKYYLDKTLITVTNFSDSATENRVTDTLGDVIIQKPAKSLPSKLIAESVYGEAGDRYTYDDIKNTQRKINPYSIFTRADAERPVQVDSSNKLNRTFSLKLNKKKSLGGNINVYQSSLGAGLQINPTFFNRNLGFNAVKLEFSPSYSLDLTAPDEDTRFNFANIDEMIIDRTLGASLRISTPRLLLFGLHIPKKKNYFSESAISVAITNNNRSFTFNFNNYLTSINYQYKPSKKITYDFKPLFTNITQYRYRSEEFKADLDTNFILKQTFSSSFILGEFLGFSASNLGSNKRTKRYISLSVEEAGGLIQLMENLFPNFLKERDYSKYIKLDLNASVLYQRNKASYGTRLLMGTGFLRDDTRALPFVKQYVVGGPYELRGFRIRSIGPGHFRDSSVFNKSSAIYQSADIKLVFNNEYRFDISKTPNFGLEGALFVDLGNIWTSRYDEDRPGSKFDLGNLYRDIAISGGYGLRANIAGILLLRFDLGTRLKYPDYYNINHGWVQNTEALPLFQYYRSLTSGQIAVGYPF